MTRERDPANLPIVNPSDHYGPLFPTPAERWRAITDHEIGLLISGLAAADRESNTDRARETLRAELKVELARRLRNTT